MWATLELFMFLLFTIGSCMVGWNWAMVGRFGICFFLIIGPTVMFFIIGDHWQMVPLLRTVIAVGWIALFFALGRWIDRALGPLEQESD